MGTKMVFYNLIYFLPIITSNPSYENSVERFLYCVIIAGQNFGMKTLENNDKRPITYLC